MKRIILLILSVSLGIGLFFCSQDRRVALTREDLNSNVVLKTVEPFYYVYISYQGPFTGHEDVIRTFQDQIANQNIEATGPVMAIYYNSPWEVEPADLKWAIAVPVSDSMHVDPPLQTRKWEGPQIASYLYTGSYESITPAYQDLRQYIEDHNLRVNGPAIERFLDPDPLKLPEDSLQTEVWLPVEYQ